GRPPISPVPPFIVSPAGSCPETRLNVYGDCPPAALTVAEYGVATTPEESVVAPVNVSFGMTVRVNALATAAPSVSETWSVKVDVAPSAVPEIRPAGSRVRPVGSAPAAIDQR